MKKLKNYGDHDSRKSECDWHDDKLNTMRSYEGLVVDILALSLVIGRICAFLGIISMRQLPASQPNRTVDCLHLYPNIATGSFASTTTIILYLESTASASLGKYGKRFGHGRPSPRSRREKAFSHMRSAPVAAATLPAFIRASPSPQEVHNIQKVDTFCSSCRLSMHLHQIWIYKNALVLFLIFLIRLYWFVVLVIVKFPWQVIHRIQRAFIVVINGNSTRRCE